MKFVRSLRFSLVVAVLLSLVIVGCASAPAKLDSSIKGPQIIVNPQEIPLGVASLMALKMTIQGSGFKPNDSVLITLNDGKDMDMAMATAKVGDDGNFTVDFWNSTPDSLAKVSGILKAGFGQNKKGETTIVLKNDPIKTGAYKIKAESYIAPISAETPVQVVDDSLGGKLKDSLGKMAGKIEDKRK